MLEYFFKGGMMMYPLLVCSVLSLAIIINRVVYFIRLSKDEKRLLPAVGLFIRDGQFSEALGFLSKSDSSIAKILKSGLEQKTRGPEKVRDSFERSELEEIPVMEKYLSVLGTIGSISTLLGFTGTVTGMINAFNAIAREGVSSPTIVASGIAEALITTAYGLFIAIPTLVAYHYFTAKIDRLTLEIEKFERSIL